MQFTTVNKCQSSKKYLRCRAPQGSVLGPLLFILFINDLHKSVEFSSVHHFADDTNLILTDKSIKAKSLNTSKTELVIFKPKNKIITKHLNFRISS